MTPANPPRSVPLRALLLSLASLAVPVVGQLVFPGLVRDEFGIVVWASALVPAFLLAYYRGSGGVAVAVATGMAVLSLTQTMVSALGLGAPNWTVLFAGVGVYLVICGGIALIAELLHRERQAAERLALVDPVTGLPNRRHAEMTLDREAAAAARGRKVCAILFDLDHFKQVNDRHGHDAGDAALRAFGDVLRRHTRRMDFSGRFGGEEFLTVLTDCAPDAALAFADRVRSELGARTFSWGRLTVSAGVAGYTAGMGSHELLLAAADRALYKAKQSGRNRAALADQEREATPVLDPVPPPPPPPSAPEPRVAADPATSILVIDDDRDVLSAVVRTLQSAGYQVEGTTRPEAVLRRYQNRPDSVDLLVSDVLMPDMTGGVMVDLILPYRPDLRVVYMSGYVQKGGVTWAGLPGAVVGFVPKPIEMSELLEAVRDALSRSPTVPE